MMDDHNHFKNTQIVIFGVCVALATVLSSVIISRAMIQVKRIGSEVIGVTGTSERLIKSDLAVWTVEFTRRSSMMTTAYQSLKEDLSKVRGQIIAEGIKEQDIIVNSVTTSVLYRKNERGNDTNEVEAYRLSQSVTVRSTEVDTVSLASREVTDLIRQGVELMSNAPEYFYTKLSELKLELLAEASQNAKQRAEQMASRTGNKIGVMRSAKTGVFQVTSANSVEVSDWGVNDTAALDKKVTAVVHLDFAISA